MGAINARDLEAAAVRAWPALESERLDGWLLRRTPTVARRRSNSALPIGRDGVAVEIAEETYAHVLQRIPGPVGFAIAHLGGRPAGVGIAVSLAAWSRERGARGVYLQVEHDNPGARAFYASLGFTRSHGYHFRTAP